ncbi:MAG: sulfite exporter TauE/SafE family protein [Gemmatimonadota bacterium]|nr:MAG: sulfite exporter TauE/SafE family protein [Gemmatimonadota bacterium]
MLALGTGLGFVIGLALGLLGGGGSILTVPIFVYVIGYGAKESIAMSLAVVGATSLTGAIGHWRIGNVHLRIALVFGAVAMIGTYLGARLSAFFSGAAQLVLFALVVLAAAYFMLRGRVPGVGATDHDLHLADRGRLPFFLIAAEGLAVGVLTGLVGVGGGFLIVPALVLLARVPIKQAVGTSLLVIAMKSATGFLGYLGQVEVDWSFMGIFTGVAMMGILTGTYFVRFVPQQALRRAFAVFLLVVGAAILYQNRAVLWPGTWTAGVRPGGPETPSLPLSAL